MHNAPSAAYLRPQMTDHLPLAEMLAGMRSMGRPEDYVQGYRIGYEGLPFSSYRPSEPLYFTRGLNHGNAAAARGAHKRTNGNGEGEA